MRFKGYYLLPLILICLTVTLAVGDEHSSSSGWRKHTINDRSPFEAAGVADFNSDGLLDVFSGDSWYAAPGWTRHKVREVPAGTNPHYHEDFADLPLDVNGDGKADIVTVPISVSGLLGWSNQPIRLSLGKSIRSICQGQWKRGSWSI